MRGTAARSAPGTQVLVSQHHSPMNGPRLPGERTETKAEHVVLPKRKTTQKMMETSEKRQETTRRSSHWPNLVQFEQENK